MSWENIELEVRAAGSDSPRVSVLQAHVNTAILFFLHRTRLVELTAKARLPTMYGTKEYAEAGGLMTYGTNYLYNYRYAAVYVDSPWRRAPLTP